MRSENNQTKSVKVI